MLSGPYLLHIGAHPAPEKSKGAIGLATFAPERCIGFTGHQPPWAVAALDFMSIQAGYAQGARTLVLGSVGPDGQIDPTWIPSIETAVRSGMHVVNGHHNRLTDLVTSSGCSMGELADQFGVRLCDIRHFTQSIPLGNGDARRGFKILTVGTDCSSGKMFTSLLLYQWLCQRSIESQFVATGQTGIMISGHGIPIDAIVSDFMSGAIESLTPDYDGVYVIEGQGSLHHPAYAGVSLGILHGAQADGIVMCHNPAKVTMTNSSFSLPSVDEAIKLTLTLGRRTNPSQRCLGVCLNTRDYSEDDARALILDMENQFQLPVTDPYRFGIDAIGDAIIRHRQACS